MLDSDGIEYATQVMNDFRDKALEILIEAINPKKSHTFRSGKTGGWVDHFSEENKALFKEVSGDLLERLGYEENNDW